MSSAVEHAKFLFAGDPHLSISETSELLRRSGFSGNLKSAIKQARAEMGITPTTGRGPSIIDDSVFERARAEYGGMS